MRRGIRAVTILSVMLLGLCGCAKKEEPLTADTDTIILNQEGSVTGYITGAFDEEIYSFEDLQAMIDSEIEVYCGQNGEGVIVLDKSEVSEGTLTVVMTYQSPQDYSAFNQEIFFYGTVEEALQEGYELQELKMSDAADLEVTVSGEELVAMTDSYILITEDPSNIRSKHKIAYIGLNDSLIGEYEVDTNDEEEMHYVIFK